MQLQQGHAHFSVGSARACDCSCCGGGDDHWRAFLTCACRNRGGRTSGSACANDASPCSTSSCCWCDSGAAPAPPESRSHCEHRWRGSRPPSATVCACSLERRSTRRKRPLCCASSYSTCSGRCSRKHCSSRCGLASRDVAPHDCCPSGDDTATSLACAPDCHSDSPNET